MARATIARAQLQDRQHRGFAVLPTDLTEWFDAWFDEVAELLEQWPECPVQFMGAPTYGIMNIFPLEERCTGIEHHTQLLERLLPPSSRRPAGGVRRPGNSALSEQVAECSPRAHLSGTGAPILTVDSCR